MPLDPNGALISTCRSWRRIRNRIPAIRKGGVTSGVNFTQNQGFEFPYDVVSASSPDPVEDATVLGPIKAKPCGWPRRRGHP